MDLRLVRDALLPAFNDGYTRLCFCLRQGNRNAFRETEVKIGRSLPRIRTPSSRHPADGALPAGSWPYSSVPRSDRPRCDRLSLFLPARLAASKKIGEPVAQAVAVRKQIPSVSHLQPLSFVLRVDGRASTGGHVQGSQPVWPSTFGAF
jgi:hypothetical protein